MIGIARVKVGSINDQIITCLAKGEGMVTFSEGFRLCVCIRVEIVAYKTRKSDAVIIGIMPFADNRKNILNSVSTFKLIANGGIILQLGQKVRRIISDALAPLNVGNLIALNITLEDLETAERVVVLDVLLSVVCKRGYCHGTHHGNCQQRSHEFLNGLFHSG